MTFRSVFPMLNSASARSNLRIVAAVFALLAWNGAVLAADNSVKNPDCAALEAWAKNIDGKDRVMPVEGNRAWMPKAFQDPAFAELFGMPAMEWSVDDTQALRAHLRACGREAAKARRKDARNALNAASGYVGGNLRGVLSAAASQKQLATQDAQRAAQRQAHEKARAEKLRAEAQRRSARERSAAQRGPEQQQQRPQPTARASAQQATSAAPRDPTAGEKVVADYRNKIEKLENFVDSLHFLSRWEQEIPQKVTPLAGKAETDKLLEMTEAKRKSIREYIVAAAKKSIDEAEAKSDTDRHALDRIERTSINIANAMLAREQVKEVQAYAREHQVALADRELAAAEKKLGDYPETMKGLDKLQRDVHLARTGVLSRGSEAAMASYLKAARARLAEVAEEALPEFKEALAGLPDSPIGLRATEMTVVKAKGFQEVAPAVRADYETALQARREAIGKAIGVRVETARTEAVAAGGDPDLVGHLYVDAAKGWQLLFRDENQAVLASRRNRDTSPYEVRGNKVVVKGPQISLVLTRSGSGAATKLEGLGFVFVRKN